MWRGETREHWGDGLRGVVEEPRYFPLAAALPRRSQQPEQTPVAHVHLNTEFNGVQAASRHSVNQRCPLSATGSLYLLEQSDTISNAKN